jgi:peptidoglycan/LPS O-acetylase OafA/YrhL
VSLKAVGANFLVSGLGREDTMIRERALKIALALVGLLFLAGLYAITTTNEPADQMLGVVYATLGVFLLLALRNTSANPSLIAFTAWSSIAHAAIMALQAYPARGSAARRASARDHRLSTALARATEG